MYLHVDDPPFKKLPLRSPWPCREIKRRTISLVGLEESQCRRKPTEFRVPRSPFRANFRAADDTSRILTLGGKSLPYSLVKSRRLARSQSKKRRNSVQAKVANREFVARSR